MLTKSRIRRFARATIFLLLATSLSLLFSSCGSDSASNTVYVRAPIEGDPAVIERLAGSWYWRMYNVRVVTVRNAREPWIEVVARPGALVERAYTEGDAITFTLVEGETVRHRSLAPLDSGSARLVSPGVDPRTAFCGSCNPPLVRSTWAENEVERMKFATRGFLEGLL